MQRCTGTFSLEHFRITHSSENIRTVSKSVSLLTVELLLTVTVFSIQIQIWLLKKPNVRIRPSTANHCLVQLCVILILTLFMFIKHAPSHNSESFYECCFSEQTYHEKPNLWPNTKKALFGSAVCYFNFNIFCVYQTCKSYAASHNAESFLRVLF